MKNLIAAVLIFAASGAASAAGFGPWQGLAVAAPEIQAVSGPELVTREAAAKSVDNTKGYLSFINWGLYQPTRRAAIVIYGPVARNLYDTMFRAKYRPAPANLASLHPNQVSRDICEARLGRQITCLKIPQMTATALVLTNGRPTYTDDSYQCDISVSDSETMEFGPSY